jgi:hypothetical protein
MIWRQAWERNSWTSLAGPSEALKRIRPSFATSAVRLNRSAAARLHSQRLDTGDRFTFR